MALFGPYSLWHQLWSLPVRASRTIWFACGPVERTAAILPLIAALRERFARVEPAFSPASTHELSDLTAMLPDGRVVYPPLSWPAVLRRHLIDLDVRLLVVLAAAEGLGLALANAAARRAIPIVLLRAHGDPPWSGPAPSLEIYFGNQSATSASNAERVLSVPESLDGAAVDEIVSAIRPLLALDLKLRRGETRFYRRAVRDYLGRSLEEGFLKRLLGRRLRRIETLEDLRRELKRPRTILCLGNGPTSEDPGLAEQTHDCLFRVNHMWLDREKFTDPDVVFCGSAATVSRVRKTVFAFQSGDSERRLLTNLLFLCLSGPQRYISLERFSLFFSEERWRGLRPTNGAAMLATASALQPDRLVIAGIDLFSHPAGSYPGDSVTPNAYTPGHEPDSELALLLEALDRFKGDLVILSPALLAAWQRHRQMKP